ncbi:MAG: tetratricopeptide repeat protein [Nitrosomonas sp.]|nr:tetratricopeptide repeat protein [Nitrosomonas sp.]MDR4652081.1 tetratricopeptide repeat protein [Nitrosomonas sp.]
MLKLKTFGWLILAVVMLGGCTTTFSDKSKPAPVNTAGTETRSGEADATYGYYNEGKKFQQNERFAEAIDAYNKALSLDDEYVDAYNGLGIVYAMLGEHALAIELMTRAVQLAPMTSYLHNNLGYVYLRQSRFNEAVRAFQQAIDLDPDNAGARINLTTAYRKLGCAEDRPCGQWQDAQ